MLIYLGHIEESELNTIDSSDYGSLVSHLVNFLYTGDYPTSADTSYVEDPSTADNAKNTSRDLDTHTYTESLESIDIDKYLAKPQSVAFSASDNTNIPRTLGELDHQPKAATSKPSPPDYSVHVENVRPSRQIRHPRPRHPRHPRHPRPNQVRPYLLVTLTGTRRHSSKPSPASIYGSTLESKPRPPPSRSRPCSQAFRRFDGGGNFFQRKRFMLSSPRSRSSDAAFLSTYLQYMATGLAVPDKPKRAICRRTCGGPIMQCAHKGGLPA